MNSDSEISSSSSSSCSDDDNFEAFRRRLRRRREGGRATVRRYLERAVVDPSGRLSFWWSAVVSGAFVYNFWAIVFRCCFDEVSPENAVLWFVLDYTADACYLLDMLLGFRTGFVRDGVVQRQPSKTVGNYVNSAAFCVDCLALLPLDLLYPWLGVRSTLRFSRLLKAHRFWNLLDRTERHTNFPNFVRTVTLLHSLFALYHWNACLIHVFATVSGEEEPRRTDAAAVANQSSSRYDVLHAYLYSMYLSTLSLTTMGKLQTPSSQAGYAFALAQFVGGLLLYATVLGHVANIVTNVSFARKEFQGIDTLKIALEVDDNTPKVTFA